MRGQTVVFDFWGNNLSSAHFFLLMYARSGLVIDSVNIFYQDQDQEQKKKKHNSPNTSLVVSWHLAQSRLGAHICASVMCAGKV